MEITVDTLPDGQQDEPVPLLRPMGVSGGNSVGASRSQVDQDEVAGDLLDMQVKEPMVQQHFGFESREHSHSRSDAPIAKYIPASPFASSLESNMKANTGFEGEENPRPQTPPSSTSRLPTKFRLWHEKFKNSGMSASATEFRPGGMTQPLTPSRETKDPIFQPPYVSGKRSMAIPIIKPPPRELDMIAAPKPDKPMSSHEDEGTGGGWGGGVAGATGEVEEIPDREEMSVPESKEIQRHREEEEEVDNRIYYEAPEEITQTEGQALQQSPSHQDVENVSASDVVVGPEWSRPQPELKHEESTPYRRASLPVSETSTPIPAVSDIQRADTSPRALSILSDDDIDNESNLLKSEILELKEEALEPPGPPIVEREYIETPIVGMEGLGDQGNGGSIGIVGEEIQEVATSANTSSAEMLAVLMSGVEFQPASDTSFRKPPHDDFKWDEETAVPMTEEASGGGNFKPEGDCWGTTSPEEDPQAASNGAGWDDWSTNQPSGVDNQWDDRGHVARDIEGDDEWGPPKPKQPEYVDTPKPTKPVWAMIAAAPAKQTIADSGTTSAFVNSPRPTEAPPVKKIATAPQPVGSPMKFPPRPGSAHKVVNPGQKRGAAPCVYIYFVPPPNRAAANLPTSNKVSIVESTAIRKLAVLYTKHFKDDHLLSLVSNERDHYLELRVSKSDNGPVTKHKVHLDSRLIDYDLGSEIWVSIVYIGLVRNTKKLSQ
ncbi:hypothetical protein TWF718_010476 [Orbilia javanica]|uniref:Uncharacterized protein n=1 Tax=Orbilia javanica TaxID=47235 RepID=A0AAN8NPQ3_9PEZI